MIDASVLYNALAALQAVNTHATSSATIAMPISNGLWMQVSRAYYTLEAGLQKERLMVEVAPPEDGDIPALP